MFKQHSCNYLRWTPMRNDPIGAFFFFHECQSEDKRVVWRRGEETIDAILNNKNRLYTWNDRPVVAHVLRTAPHITKLFRSRQRECTKIHRDTGTRGASAAWCRESWRPVTPGAFSFIFYGFKFHVSQSVSQLWRLSHHIRRYARHGDECVIRSYWNRAGASLTIWRP